MCIPRFYCTMLINVPQQPAYALQSVLCAESTPVLACIIPAFNTLLSTWNRMLADPSKHHLKSMLKAGITKLISQYNEHQFTKTAIILIGTVISFFKSSSYSILIPVLHPGLHFKWIEQHWPKQCVDYAKCVIEKEVVYIYTSIIHCLSNNCWF